MLVFICINNIAGYEVPEKWIKYYKDRDVKKEFNGDFGCTAFIKYPQSDYGNDYKYMIVEFFYKENQGVVMRTFLFNDLELMGVNKKGKFLPDSILLEHYHTFKFMEKDKDGNYIHEYEDY